MKKIFLSLPMRDKTDEEILDCIERMKISVKEKYGDKDVTIIDNFIMLPDDAFECASAKHSSLAFLSKALAKMANCDAVAIWYTDEVRQGMNPGVLVEEMCAKYYGIEIYYIYPNIRHEN